MNSNIKNSEKAWFQQDRFGMFIHWGLYAITGRDMWYYSHEEVNQEHYERLFKRFNPTDYDPIKWARLAKQAGFKYAVFIAKHHEGFCLWDSKYTDFKVSNTSYGRDITRMWLDAFRAEGLKVGIYYSLLDWHHPHFTVDYHHPQRARMDELNRNRDFSKYVEYLHNQVCELMTDYGKIDIFWSDFSYGTSPQTGLPGKSAYDWHSFELKEKILNLQPDILINNRMGIPGEIPSDFTTPEQNIPTEDVVNNTEAPMWEACETIGGSWGYYRGDGSNKSPAEIIKHLVMCVSNNGNLLLNVGPTPRGRIQPEIVERLKEVGEWMDLYGESLYGAGKAECEIITELDHHPLFTQNGQNVYIHFLKGEYPPFNIILKNMGNKIDYVEFVSDKTEIEFETIELSSGSHVRLFMPFIMPNPYDTVVRVVLK